MPQEYISRMIEAGVPEETAREALRQFSGDKDKLELYIVTCEVLAPIL